MKRPEQELQKAIFRYVSYQYPEIVCYHIPNGGRRSKIEAAIFKSLGVIAGLPDLVIAKPIDTGLVYYGGLYLELKAPKGKVQESQKLQIEKLRKAGYKVEVCKSFDEAKLIVDNYLRL